MTACECYPYTESHGEPGLEPNPDCPAHFPKTDETTDPVIPPEAIEAAMDVVMDDGHNGIQCRPDRNLGKTVRAALEAALPHLPARQIGDELAPELRQEIRTVMELGRALGKAEGRREALAEGVAAIERCEDDARRAEERTHDRGWSDIATGYMRSAEILRGIGKGNSV